MFAERKAGGVAAYRLASEFYNSPAPYSCYLFGAFFMLKKWQKMTLRIGMETGQSLLDEVGKRDWYLNKAAELRIKK